MARFDRGDYEPRRSARQVAVVTRFSPNHDDDGDGDSEDDGSWENTQRKRPARKRAKRAVSSSDEQESDADSSDISVSSRDEDEMSDENPRRRLPSKRQAKTASYLESESEQEDSEDASDSDDSNDSDSPKKRTAKSENVENLFEEIGERTIEKVVNSRVNDNGISEYEVKWKGRSYRQTSWHSEDELIETKGFRILSNYVKLVDARHSLETQSSAEQLEQFNIAQEMALQKRKLYTVAERVLAMRVKPDTAITQYLVKWTDLPHDECTWEDADDLQADQELIDSHLERTRNPVKPSARSGKNAQTPFSKLEQQPEWMVNAGTLRDYQLEGLNWLRFSNFEKRNVILADEMGLGKTIQCISFLGCMYADMGNPGPYLVVVPLSTIAAWKREFKKWVPWMNVIEYRGNVKARLICRQYEFGTNKSPQFHVVLTNYEVVNKDFQHLDQYTWSYLIVDEAHRLKDDQSLLYQTLKSLRSSHRLLITGTPLQNSVKELWCLLQFLEPHKFHSLDEFQSLYGEITEATASVRHLARLHDLLNPYLLRRTKSDVLKSLPSKTERILRIDMSDMQKRYYRWILTKNFHELNKGLKGGSMSSLSNTIMELKKVSNHPYLFDNAELKNHENTQQELSRLVSNSGKMVLLDRLLDRLFETGHRVLIFSQMVRMLDILADYLVLKGFKFQRLDGGMTSENRQHAMDHFNAEGSPDFVFLLSTRAGGLGVNLATADTVIIFDSDWNPQNDLQAEARAHRIGQTKTVNIYRFVTKHTVEEDILEKAKRKMILDHLVIQKMDTSGKGALSSLKNGNKRSQFDKAELMKIVEFGAKQLFEEGVDTSLSESNAPQAPPPAFDLDEILARAETTTDRSSVDQTDEFLSAFKFANFVSTSNNSEVVVKTATSGAASGEGSFWEKIIPAHLRPTPASEFGQEELVYPRRAKFGKVFDEEDGAAVKRTRPSHKASKKTDPVREVKQAVKTILQFGDQPSAVKCMNGDAEKNKAMLSKIIKACTSSESDTVKVEGVEVDAASVRSRVNDMMMLKKQVDACDSPFERFRVTAPISSVRWKCAWGVRHDSMLLLGVYVHGMGAWNEICNDKRLGIGTTVHKAGSSERVVGNNLLSSRVQSLLRAMRSQEQKRTGLGKDPSDNSHKRKHSDMVDSHSRVIAKKRVSPPTNVNDAVIDPKVADWCLKTLKEEKSIVKTLKKLKTLRLGPGLSSDYRAVVKYIFRIGDYITRTGNEDRCNFASSRVIEQHLWSLSAPFLQSTAAAVSSLYWDLAAEPTATSKQEAIIQSFERNNVR